MKFNFCALQRRRKVKEAKMKPEDGNELILFNISKNYGMNAIILTTVGDLKFAATN